FMGESYIPGPWLGCVVTGGVASGPGCVPSQGGYPAGGCIYPSPTPAPANLIGSVNNQTNGGFQWDCDGPLAMIDPAYGSKGPRQPKLPNKYPMYQTPPAPVREGLAPANGYYVPIGQPFDGVVDTGNPFYGANPNGQTGMLGSCPNFPPPNFPAPGGQPTCPN